MPSYLFVLLHLFLLYHCAAADVTINVDALNGVDNSSCITSLSYSCQSIGYAVNNIPYGTSSAVIIAAPGVYAGPSNANMNVQLARQFTLMATDPSHPAIIDCQNNPSNSGILIGRSCYVVNIINMNFKGCTNALGGALSLHNIAGSVAITNCTFTGNVATQSGGAIYVEVSSLMVVTGCVFSNNSAAIDGGAIAASTMGLQVYDTLMEKNEAGRAGGATYGSDLNFLLMQDDTLLSNVAKNQGGAIFTETNDLKTTTTIFFTNCTLDDNCVLAPYYDSYTPQEQCTGSCVYIEGKIHNVSGCLNIFRNNVVNSVNGVSNNGRIIIIAVVVPFCVLAALSIAAYLFFKKKHDKEMARREDYRKMILKALNALVPQEEDVELLDPYAEKCKLCLVRPINAQLPCTHEVVCSVCKIILLECPVCKAPTR